MSIKGFSTQKKLETDISGYLDSQTKDSSQFATAQKTSSDKVLMDATSNNVFRLHAGAKTTEAGSDQRVIKNTAHGAMAGDLVRFELASQNAYFESNIVSAPDANTIILAAQLPSAPVVGDQFFILRYASQRVDSSGSTIVITTPSVNTNGSVVNGTLSTTVPNTEAPPGGAVGFYLMNESTNVNSIRFRVGGVASTALGVLLEPGRSSDYVPIAASISIVNTVSSTQLYNLLWVIA